MVLNIIKAAHPSPAGQTSALAKYTGKDVQSILKMKYEFYKPHCGLFLRYKSELSTAA
jgi:hypothetical protein